MIVMVNRKDLTYILLYLWEDHLINYKHRANFTYKLLNVTKNNCYEKYEATNFDLYNASRITKTI